MKSPLFTSTVIRDINNGTWNSPAVINPIGPSSAFQIANIAPCDGGPIMLVRVAITAPSSATAIGALYLHLFTMPRTAVNTVNISLGSNPDEFVGKIEIPQPQPSSDILFYEDTTLRHYIPAISSSLFGILTPKNATTWSGGANNIRITLNAVDL